MNSRASDKVLVFSEEYSRITKGLVLVWMTHAATASSKRQVDILLNGEHWALDEAITAFQANTSVAVDRLPFSMPSTLLQRALSGEHCSSVMRAAKIVVGQALNLLFSPLIILYLCQRLRRLRPRAVFSHSGGWPAGDLCRWIICAAWLAKVPKRILIIHSHPVEEFGLWYVASAPLRFGRAWSIDRCATSIVAVSDSVKAALASKVFERPVLRIHNGINPSAGEPRSIPSSTNLDWHPSGLVVGFVGALYPMKGVHVLLDAFRSVNVPCELALLGPAVGPAEYVRSLQRRANLCPNTVSFSWLSRRCR